MLRVWRDALRSRSRINSAISRKPRGAPEGLLTLRKHLDRSVETGRKRRREKRVSGQTSGKAHKPRRTGMTQRIGDLADAEYDAFSDDPTLVDAVQTLGCR